MFYTILKVFVKLLIFIVIMNSLNMQGLGIISSELQIIVLIGFHISIQLAELRKKELKCPKPVTGIPVTDQSALL
jgi:hypothetical protein